MGYATADGLDLVVTDTVGPGPEAEHGSHAFVPDYSYHEQRAADLYRTSCGKTTYLGDWHTHPAGTPLPSRKDRAALHQIATAPEARAPEPIMCIAAAGSPWLLAVWQLQAGFLRRPLRILPARVFD